MKLGVRVAKSGLARFRLARLLEIRPGSSNQRGPGTELWDATGIAEQIETLHVLLSKGDRELSRATDCDYRRALNLPRTYGLGGAATSIHFDRGG